MKDNWLKCNCLIMVLNLFVYRFCMREKRVFKKGEYIKWSVFNIQNNMEENKISKEKKGTKITKRYPKNSNAQKNTKRANNKKENVENTKSIMPVKKEKNSITKVPEKGLAVKEEFSFKKDNLKIIPLGGIEEIGKNITVFEYGNDIVLVDCGVAFPEDDMLGIDLVIPDFTYLERNKDRIRGLVITHGHEDHIGSIAYLLKQINVPIYATKLTIGLISNKLEEHRLLKTAKLHVVKQGQTIVLGKIRVEFIRSCHSIPDSVALAIHTPVGTVVHTGDFKIDYTPIDDQKIDLGRLAELGNR